MGVVYLGDFSRELRRAEKEHVKDLLEMMNCTCRCTISANTSKHRGIE